MSELDARPILASLANPTSREMFARVVLGTVGTSSRRGEERALAQLESAGLITDETVTEPELNQRLESLTADVARLRRAFVDHGILNRDAAGTQYRLAAG